MTEVSGWSGTRAERIGEQEASSPLADTAGPRGEFVLREGVSGYEIRGYDRMPPFLISLPSDTDLWMFVSSAGGMTAGRRDPDGALFPYETVDRLHDSQAWSGPVTLLRVTRGRGPAELWQPLAGASTTDPAVARTLFKSITGNRITFTERDSRRELAFHASWCGSDATGWVRTVTLENLGTSPVHIELLDGARDLLPFGAPLSLQQHSSCLVDAYKRVDVDPFAGLAIACLTARVSDRPEPAEELRATIAWCHGLPGHEFALSVEALEAFRRGEPFREERTLTGRRTNVFVHAELAIAPRGQATWHLVLDTGRSHLQVGALRSRLLRREDLGGWIEGALCDATENLERIVASSDGIQASRVTATGAHHFANVLFNDLRGGVFVEDHQVPTADLAAFARVRDKAVAARHSDWFASLPESIDVTELHHAAARTGDPGLRRVCFEYLPLFFGRRHGDPSRPWNRFQIRVREADGSRALRYEGNWRDVFQNWEALAMSFPGFLPSMIAKFVNASTVDGFNPYRISREGVDWEVLDPENPWSGIGYWGDHQIVYLTRLLEQLRRASPGTLEALLAEAIFSYADVPYRLRPYADLVTDPRATIQYDAPRAKRILSRAALEGQDGKLVHDGEGGILHATLLEKLLVPVLAKWSSFVPGAGIWMNTERPEWNDANNALVGTGVSTVTLCHLARHLALLESIVADAGIGQVAIAGGVVAWMRATTAVAESHRTLLDRHDVTAAERASMMDALGEAFSAYRGSAYERGPGVPEPVPATEVLAFLRVVRAHVDHAVRQNRRDDALYHAYHVLERDTAGVHLRPLDEMLEGQVAALGSGLIPAEEAVELLQSLFGSALHRADQQSFLLYPEHELPSFLDRNRVPETRALRIPLIAALLAMGDESVIARDAFGVLRFQAEFANVRDVQTALDSLAASEVWREAVPPDREAVADLFIDTFGHRTFTGRSGTMYAYEGLGSIYWHMVAKLLLAVQEQVHGAFDRGEPAEVRDALMQFYDRVRAGLGFTKSPQEYGAFPTDPYSHTPAHAGAQQPGMTGQVKEEILTRFGELGVRIGEGVVRFEPLLLRREEFLTSPRAWTWIARDGRRTTEKLPAGTLAFTFAQTPVIYTLVPGAASMRLTHRDGAVTERMGTALDGALSHALLSRDGSITRIDVSVANEALRAH